MSKKDNFLNILKDNEWHCAICDLGNSSQHAAIIRDLAKDGCEFDNNSEEATQTYSYGVKKWCNKCQKQTTHRRLKEEK